MARRHRALRFVGVVRYHQALSATEKEKIYLAVTGWTLVYILRDRPEEGWLGLAIIAAGALFYAGTVLVSRSR